MPRSLLRDLIRAVKRLERAGHSAPAAAEALKEPVIISNKVGRGVSPEEAERAKQETIQKLMRWKARSLR